MNTIKNSNSPAGMNPTDEELKRRIIDVMGHLPLADQGEYVIEQLRAGFVWSVKTEGLAIKSMRYFVPTAWCGPIPPNH